MTPIFYVNIDLGQSSKSKGMIIFKIQVLTPVLYQVVWAGGWILKGQWGRGQGA